VLHQGEEVAHLLPYDTFKIIKKLQKAGKLKNYCDETGKINLESISEELSRK
jgi:hypothetical protein